MCYVIENFQPTFTHLRYYPRLRVMFFFRNVRKIFVLASLFFNSLTLLNYSQVSLNFFNSFFLKSFTLIPVSPLQVRSTPVKLNFSHSLQFWALTGSLFLYNYNKNS
jgi:hypothetical protein